MPRFTRKSVSAPGRRRVGRWDKIERSVLEGVTLAAAAAILIGMEIAGRWTDSELVDLVCVIGLIVTMFLLRDLKLQWIRRVGLWFRKLKSVHQRLGFQWRFQWGIDLRQTPPVTRGIPRSRLVLPILLGGLAIAAVGWASVMSDPLKSWVVPGSYLVYLIGVAALWVGLICVMIVSSVVAAWIISDWVTTHFNGDEKTIQWKRRTAILLHFAVVMAAALLLPRWIATALLLVCVPLATLMPWMLRNWPDCVWRFSSEAPLRSMSVASLLSLQMASITLFPLVLVLFALGPEALPIANGYEPSPVSLFLGWFTAWFAALGLAAATAIQGAQWFVARRHDPGRPAKTSLHISGVEDANRQQIITAAFRERGWKVQFDPAAPKPVDVRIEILPDSRASLYDPFDPPPSSQPGYKVLPFAELLKPETAERIERWDVISRRRMVLKGLEKIFKRAAKHKNRAGCGYWVAPQYWYVDGLTRDEYDDKDTFVQDVIPPLYHKAIEQPARNHLLNVCDALDVDFMFVEDGVDFRSFKRVLRVLFERYDIDGGEQPLKEIHFLGLPKVRVMIHEYTFDNSLDLEGTKYPEPDYDQLGRVRILHVYRDRGDEESLDESPSLPDFIFEPDFAPALM